MHYADSVSTCTYILYTTYHNGLWWKYKPYGWDAQREKIRMLRFSGSYSVRMRKIRTRKTPSTDSFHAVTVGKTTELIIQNLGAWTTLFVEREVLTWHYFEILITAAQLILLI